MAVLSDYIDAKIKYPVATARINGVSRRDILSIQKQESINNAITSATIKFINVAGILPEDKLVVTQGYNGKETLTFTGLVDTITKDEFQPGYTVVARDMLKKAMDTFLVQPVRFGINPEDQKYYYSTYSTISGGTFQVYEYGSEAEVHAAHPETNGNITYEGVKAEAVVQWLLVMCGLQEGSEIQVDETNFFVGDLAPVKFHLTSVYDAIQQICELIGWYIFCDAGGVVRFKKRPRTPSGYTVWNYTDKRDPYNIMSITHTATNLDLRNYVEIHGSSGIKVINRKASPYIGNTPYRGVLIANDLIDTSGIATFMAQRVLNDLNRLKETISMDVDGNPFLSPGQTIAVRSAVATGPYMIEDVSSNVSTEGGYRSQISASRYPDDSSEEDEASIAAAFVPIQVISLGDPKIVVLFDGAPSYSNRGPIVEYDWTFPDTSYEFEDSQVWYAFDMAAITNGNSQNVTLTAFDGFGFTATTTSGITLSGLLQDKKLLYRQLYGALTNLAVGSLDGGDTWNTVPLDAISVAASNFADGGIYVTSGHALFGTQSGKIYKTNDVCKSVREVYDTQAGEVTHLHIPENFASYALASTREGNLFYSDSQGEGWTELHHFNFPITQARFSYDSLNYIMVVGSGQSNVWESYDRGANWGQLDFDGAYITWNDAGSITNYYAHTSGVYATNPTPSGVPFSGGVAPHVVAMSIEIDDDSGVMVVDRNGTHWIYASGQMTATEYNAENLTRHMIRDGEAAIVVYYATQSGVSKSIDRNRSIQELYYPSGVSMPLSPSDSVGDYGFGEMVAYGPLAPAIEPSMGRLMLVAQNVTSTLASGVVDNLNHDGMFLALEDNSAFALIPNTPVSAVAVSAGVVVYMSAGNSLGYFTMVSGTWPTGVSNVWTIPHDTATETYGSESIATFTTSYSPGGRGVHLIATIDYGLSHYRNFYSIPGFSSGDFTTRSEVGQVAGVGAYAYPVYMSKPSKNDAVAFVSISQHIIGDDYYNYGTFNFSSMELKSQHFHEDDFNRYTPLAAKFPGDLRFAARYYDGVADGPVLNKGIMSYEEAAFSRAGIINVYASMELFSDAIYADANGVYKTGQYGQGLETKLFTAPDNFPITHFSVTHNRSMSRDNISVLCYNSGTKVWQTHYSTDGGFTWTVGPTGSGGSSLAIYGIYYIDQ